MANLKRNRKSPLRPAKEAYWTSERFEEVAAMGIDDFLKIGEERSRYFFNQEFKKARKERKY